jgi:predicted O-methyltransferase YrrM
LRLLFTVFQYLKYLFKRKDEHSLHSPFLFDFYTQTRAKAQTLHFPEIETARIAFLQDRTNISPTQLGATSRLAKNKIVANIARHSLSPNYQNQYFAAIVAQLQPKIVLELGTCLGINAAYLATACPTATIYTMEGNAAIAEQAKTLFQKLHLLSIELMEGTFDELLPPFVAKVQSLDFVFFDGNHRFQPTMDYYELCLKKANPNSVFVFHDIYWSAEMAKAWKTIFSKNEVTLSVDMFHFGLVFFRDNQPKQHFVLKF